MNNRYSKLGLTLSGGGARGAYQAGVLKAFSEILGNSSDPCPFKILTGASAGAINASLIATHANDFKQATEQLADLWGSLTLNRIFKTDPLTVSFTGLTWMKRLTFGGVLSGSKSHSLLNTDPLWRLLRTHLDFNQIRSHVQSGVLTGLGVTATDYTTAHTVTFVEGNRDLKMWQRVRRRGEFTQMESEHIMASAAIPIFFPPVRVGDRYYGDGNLRNTAPLSPAIHLGADRVIVIGVRKQRHSDDDTSPQMPIKPSLARVLGVLLNAVFLDSTDLDVERLSRINETLRVLEELGKKNPNLNPIDYLWIQPSEDLGLLANEYSEHLPSFIKYLLQGMGTLEEGSELISYLLFDSHYTQRLIEVGHKDGMSHKEDFLRFVKP